MHLILLAICFTFAYFLQYVSTNFETQSAAATVLQGMTQTSHTINHFTALTMLANMVVISCLVNSQVSVNSTTVSVKPTDAALENNCRH